MTLISMEQFLKEQELHDGDNVIINHYDDDRGLYYNLNRAIGKIVSIGKLKSKIKITDISKTDLYRPKMDGVSKETMIKSSNKTYLNKSFNIPNKYIAAY